MTFLMPGYITLKTTFYNSVIPQDIFSSVYEDMGWRVSRSAWINISRMTNMDTEIFSLLQRWNGKFSLLLTGTIHEPWAAHL